MDTNPAMFPYAQKALAAAYGARAPPHVTFLKGRAEALPVESASMSAVVSTLVRLLHALPSVCVPVVAERPLGVLCQLTAPPCLPPRPRSYTLKAVPVCRLCLVVAE